jgi:endoglucanase
MPARSRLIFRSTCVFHLLAAIYLAATCGAAISYAGDLTYTGVNLSGAEFGSGHLPGTYNGVGAGPYDYIYPTSQEVDYYTNKGMNTFRLPFRWERLQTIPNSLINNSSPTASAAEKDNYAELQRMDTFVNYATSKGDYVLIDPHNFERYYPLSSNFQQSTQGLIGGGSQNPQSQYNDAQTSYNSLNGSTSAANVPVTNAMFANFWGQIAAHYANNSHVIFDLMNEPANVAATQVRDSDNAAIAAIRANGATSQLILLEGSSYSGAWTWTNNNGTDGNNSTAFAPANIVDPNNNYAFEMHQYLDSDGSGGHDTITNDDPTTGVTRLTAATNWLIANHARGFLGEFAVANSSIGNGNYTSAPVSSGMGDGLSHPQIGDETLKNMLNYMNQNSSAWLGWSWWGGGPWWGNYMFGLDPTNLSNPTDKAAMSVLAQFLPMAGDFNRDGHLDTSDISAMEAALTDLNGWYASETALGLNSTQEKIIADVNKDGVVNNADLQQLLTKLLTGGGSDAAVPEPASLVLLALAVCMLPMINQRRASR